MFCAPRGHTSRTPPDTACDALSFEPSGVPWDGDGGAHAEARRQRQTQAHKAHAHKPARGRCPQPITGPLPTTVRGGCASRNGRIHSWKLLFRPPDHQSRWPSAHAPSARALLSVSAVRGEHAVLGEHAGHDTPQLSLSLRLYPLARAIRRSAQLSTLSCP